MLQKQHDSSLGKSTSGLIDATVESTVEGDPLLSMPEGRTDLANARRFARIHRDRVRYCYDWKSWVAWDGKRWCQNRAIVERLAKEIPDFIWSQAGGDSHVQKFAARSADGYRLRSMLSLAESEVGLEIEPDELNGQPWLLNCTNGTVDLKTGKIHDHKPEDMLTQLCPTPYSAVAVSDRWEQFLKEVFRDDGDLIRFIQRFLGYCLTGNVREQILPIFWGDGANGKSTLLNAFIDVLGQDYAMQATPELLMASKHDRHPTERADLFGKRFVSTVETAQGRQLNETLVKQLTGGERIRARRMRQDFFEFDPTHKIVLCTNHKPSIQGADHAIWRRIACVPFKRRFDGNEVDRTLPDKLRQESQGILAWAVQGCLDWQRSGLAIPKVVAETTDEYRREENVIERFVNECCDTLPFLRVRFKDFYERLSDFCHDDGCKVPERRQVGSWLKTRFQEKSSNGRVYEGIGFK